MEDNILKQIFFDEHKNWDKFVDKYGKRIRDIVIKEVEKFRKCGEKEAGFTLFACPVCGEMKVIPHTCKGRFCTSCSTSYTQEWSKQTARRMYAVPHRHIMFTLDERLWEIFIKHRELLKNLMDIAVDILLDWLKKRGKVKSGAMVGIHTFGARMNFNPHVHVLVTEGGFDRAGNWVNKDYIPYAMLRKRWQAAVMEMLRKNLREKELKLYKKIFQQVWDDNPEGFIIYGPPNKRKGQGTVEAQVGYIGRYMRRPAMARGRIVSYDGKTVTFKYFDKTNQVEAEETVTVEEFISRIIRHIPDEQFKTIRYYGIYSRRGKGLADKLMQAGRKKWVKINAKPMGWREKYKEFTGQDPLVCPRCKEYMEYKGKVCLKSGKLQVTGAVEETARKRLEELAGIAEVKNKKQNEKEKSTEKVSNHRKEHQLCMFAV